MSKKYKVCLVGATGMVGSAFLNILAEVDFPIENLKLLASARSAGKKIPFKGEELVVEELNETAFDGYDIAFFSAGGDQSLKYAPVAADKGLIVIDNSSAWRMDGSVGLVVPEVNFKDVSLGKIVANPNCSTIQSVLPLHALKDYGLKSVVYTSYQATSGSGYGGVEDLERTLAGEAPQFYPHPIAKTCIPHIDSFTENGYTKEEMKMVNETQRILGLPDLPISATCVRVPIKNGHSVSIRVEFEKEFELADVIAKFEAQPGIKVVNDGPNNVYPLATMVQNSDDVYVGRIRRDLSAPNALLFYCTADNVRKGAAGNAVQIAQKMIEKGLI